MPSEFEAQKDSTPSFLQLYRQIHSTGVFAVFVGSHLQQILPEMWASRLQTDCLNYTGHFIVMNSMKSMFHE